MNRPGQRNPWTTLMAHLAVVVVLLCLGAANLTQRATWSELEDGGGHIGSIEDVCAEARPIGGQQHEVAFGEAIRADITRFGKVIKDVGIKAD